RSFFFSSRRRHTRFDCDWSSDVCSSDLVTPVLIICALIMPANLSNAFLTGATSLLLMFIGRISLKHIFLTIGVALIPVVIIVMEIGRASCREIVYGSDRGQV